MIIILFLIAYDSLPPLPDLSTIYFPEPVLWLAPPGDSIDFMGCYGEFITAQGHVFYHDLVMEGTYKDHFNWGQARYGSGRIAYAFGLPHLWLQPAIRGFSMKRDDEYLCIMPYLSFASTNQWSIIQGTVAYSFWNINESRSSEGTTVLDIYFDRLAYKPQLRYKGLFINNQFTPQFGAAFHVQNFHVDIISPIPRYFPSPTLRISFKHPHYRFIGEVKTGTVLQDFIDRFNSELPAHYRYSIPVESLRVAIGFSASLDLYRHTLLINGMYEDWYNRVVPVYDFILNDIQDVHRVITYVGMKNHFAGERWSIEHTIFISRDWHNDIIPLQPRFIIGDTLTCNYRFIYGQASVWYHSDYRGITADLPECFLVHPTLGVDFGMVSFFISIMNVLGNSAEYFDGYWTQPRQYAGGIRFKKTFR